jgi:hypothetical protein
MNTQLTRGGYMNNVDFIKKLKELEACQEAIALVTEKKWTLGRVWLKEESGGNYKR